MKIINIYNAKSQFSSLIEQVVSKGSEIVIGKAGKAVAKIVPYQPIKKKRKLGALKGKIKMAADFDEWPEDVASSLGIKT